MRVIAGTLKGRTFDAPGGHKTHPMGEKVRGALFNTMGDITGLSLLDAYAGSGAISFEALSRGADQVVAIELDKSAHQVIVANAKKLGIGSELMTINSNSVSWSKKHIQDWFDIVICDPPYDKVPELHIQKLATHVKRGGLLVLSWPAHLPVPEFKNLEYLKHSTYAEATLIFYKKETPKI
jgi:16S rRNA (guanine966-N2)-methyltransferase